MTDGRLLQDASQVKVDVLSALHFRAEEWSMIASTTIKNPFEKCGFSNDHISNNDISTVTQRT
jgi:hypothetical protein